MNTISRPRIAAASLPDRTRVQRVGRRAWLPLALAVFLAGCAAARSPSTDPDALGGLCINGLFMRPGQTDLRQVLEWRFPASVPVWYAPGSPGPLVLVDGIAVDGVQRLGALPAATVMSVETLDGFRAVPEYGARARDGAIVVVTREGLAKGAAEKADARPVTPCSGPEESTEIFEP